LKITGFLIIKEKIKQTKNKRVMKLSRVVCLMLFLLCLSVSLATMLSFEFAIAYGVLVVIASFVFLWKSTLKCPLLRGEYCFRLLSDVIKTFATASVSVFIGSLVYALALVLINNADSESTFDSVLRFCFILCLPFFLMIVEAAAIVAIKDTNACLKMQ
jgi:surface polysaccharide O-acyltransferase-like enzyme